MLYINVYIFIGISIQVYVKLHWRKPTVNEASFFFPSYILDNSKTHGSECMKMDIKLLSVTYLNIWLLEPYIQFGTHQYKWRVWHMLT